MQMASRAQFENCQELEQQAELSICFPGWGSLNSHSPGGNGGADMNQATVLEEMYLIYQTVVTTWRTRSHGVSSD
jgi:hypothetical protein